MQSFIERLKVRGEAGSTLIETSIKITLIALIAYPGIIALSDKTQNQFCTAVGDGTDTTYVGLHDGGTQGCFLTVAPALGKGKGAVVTKLWSF
jgi:hypothetical protein